jgi:hypothetical protein
MVSLAKPPLLRAKRAARPMSLLRWTGISLLNLDYAISRGLGARDMARDVEPVRALISRPEIRGIHFPLHERNV